MRHINSAAAWASIDSARVRDKVHHAIFQAGPRGIADFELRRALPGNALSSICTRRYELETGGAVFDSGVTTPKNGDADGLPCELWVHRSFASPDLERMTHDAAIDMLNRFEARRLRYAAWFRTLHGRRVDDELVALAVAGNSDGISGLAQLGMESAAMAGDFRSLFNEAERYERANLLPRFVAECYEFGWPQDVLDLAQRINPSDQVNITAIRRSADKLRRGRWRRQPAAPIPTSDDEAGGDEAPRAARSSDRQVRPWRDPIVGVDVDARR